MKLFLFCSFRRLDLLVLLIAGFVASLLLSVAVAAEARRSTAIRTAGAGAATATKFESGGQRRRSLEEDAVTAASNSNSSNNSNNSNNTMTTTIADIIQAGQDLTMMQRALQASTNFQSELDNDSTTFGTLCLPTDMAFAKLRTDNWEDVAYMEQLLTDSSRIAHLENLLQGHSWRKVSYFANFTDGASFGTRNGEPLQLQLSPSSDAGSPDKLVATFRNTNTPGGSTIVEADLKATNGVAHKVDAVIKPPYWNRNILASMLATTDTDFSIMRQLLETNNNNNMTSTAMTSTMTILAPTDDAIRSELGQENTDYLSNPANRNALTTFLSHHTVSNKLLPSQQLLLNAVGSSVSSTSFETDGGSLVTISNNDGVDNNNNRPLLVNGADILAVTDILSRDGIVHGISNVLSTEGLLPQQQGPTPTIAAIIQAGEDLTTMQRALQAAPNFEAILNTSSSDAAPFGTMCLPTDTAFANLRDENLVDADYLEELLTDISRIAHLQNLLEGHSWRKVSYFANFTDGASFPTRNDEPLQLRLLPSDIDPDDKLIATFSNTNTPASRIVQADLKASNGVAHKVDAVIKPPFWNRDIPTSLTESAKDVDLQIMKQLLEAGNATKMTDNESITLLSPTDDALLTSLGQGGVEFLSDPSNSDHLETFLSHHIVSNRILPLQVLLDDSTSFETDAGSIVTVSSTTTTTDDNAANDNHRLVLNGADIVAAADILARNGIVHAITEVLSTDGVPSSGPDNNSGTTLSPPSQQPSLSSPTAAPTRLPTTAPTAPIRSSTVGTGCGSYLSLLLFFCWLPFAISFCRF